MIGGRAGITAAAVCLWLGQSCQATANGSDGLHVQGMCGGGQQC